mgnify:CR=1 FL=1
MRDLTKALQSLYPGSEWTLNVDDYSGLEWLETNTAPKPSREELENEAERLHTDWISKEYQRQRSPEYPSIGDQLDALFHAGVFPPEMAAKIQAIKDKYPKG